MQTNEAIRTRRTIKVMSQRPMAECDRFEVMSAMVSAAGWAPFHRGCEEVHRQGELGGIEPWRFYIVDAVNCRRLSSLLPTANAGKIPAMLKAADCLAVVTWLPNEDGDSSRVGYGDQPNFAPTLANMEHIAAASSAIQNLLLLATENGIENYWSSGGILRSMESYDLLSIPHKEILLGAIFLFPSVEPQTPDLEVVESKLRSHRTLPKQWSRWTEIK